MDPLSAFSLACGIIQVIDFSAKLVSTAKEVYEEGSPKDIKELAEQTSHMDRMLSDLKREKSGEVANQDSVENSKELLALAGKCGETTEELLEQLKKMQMPGPQSLLKAVGKSLKMKSRIKKVERLSRDLDSYHNLLDTCYLRNLSAKLNRATLEQEAGFKRLDQSHQTMARSFAEGANSCKALAQAISHNIGEQFQHRELEERRKAYEKDFLGGLFFPEITERERGIKRAHEETFRWIFDTPGEESRPWSDFADWLKTGSMIYWISGKAGSGKSTLMSYIIQNPQTVEFLGGWAGDKRLLTPRFFFWTAGTLLQKSFTGLFRSLIFQILVEHPHLIQLKSKQSLAFPGYSQALTVWTEEDLREYFLELFKAISNSFRICLFVDGLDECNGDQRDLVKLLEELVSNPNIKCCLSSRPERPFEHLTGSMLRLQDLNYTDICNYVEAKLNEIPQVQSLPAERSLVREQLKEKIIEKADGVFLWVELAVKSQVNGLGNNDSIDLLDKRFELLPTEINDLYYQMLMRADKIYREEAACYLGMTYNFINSSPGFGRVWGLNIYTIALAKHGLTETLHLSHKLNSHNVASKCSRVSEMIPISCAGLLEIINPDEDPFSFVSMAPFDSWHPDLVYWTRKRVRFLHRSVKDFLDPESPGGALLRSYSTFPKNMNLLPSAICLVQMTLCNLSDCQEYMIYYTSRLMYLTDDSPPRSQDENLASVKLLKYFDKTLQELYEQKRGSSSSNYWCQSWCDVLGHWLADCEITNEQNQPLLLEYRPSDLNSLAAWYGLDWFLVEELKDCSLSAEKANQLAFCATFQDCALFRDGGFIWPKSLSMENFRILRRLVQLVIDLNIGLSSSIWEHVLVVMYDYKLLWAGLDTDAVDTLLSQVFEIACKSGAGPTRIIFMPVNDDDHWKSYFKKAGVTGFEINISCLPIIHTSSKMLDIVDKKQPKGGSEGFEQPRRSVRLWFRKEVIKGIVQDSPNRSSDCDRSFKDDSRCGAPKGMESSEEAGSIGGNLPERIYASSTASQIHQEYWLSETQESQFYRFLRQIFDIREEEKRLREIQDLRVWLDDIRESIQVSGKSTSVYEES